MGCVDIEIRFNVKKKTCKKRNESTEVVDKIPKNMIMCMLKITLLLSANSGKLNDSND